MKIRSTYMAIEKPQTDYLVPGLYRSKNNKGIVFFYARCAGVVVFAGHSYFLGYHSTDWVPCDNTENWEPLNGELTLRQEP